MQQLITLILLALLGRASNELPSDSSGAEPYRVQDLGVDDQALEEGFDVDDFDFSPMDDRALNREMGEGDLGPAIAELRQLARARRAKVMAPVRRPVRLMPAEGTYGDGVVFDVYGRVNRR